MTDFKFVVKDRVKFEGYKATVRNVLDEMINIQYDKDEISNTKRPSTQWVDTDNKNLILLNINQENEMDVEK